MAFRKFSVDHGLIVDCHEDTTNERPTELMVSSFSPFNQSVIFLFSVCAILTYEDGIL